MAPLPTNNTAVLFVDYNTCSEDHTIQCRFDSPNTAADAMDAVDSFLTALGNSHRLMTILGARVRANGATVSVDVAWAGAATYGIGGGSHYESAQFYDFVGRSAGGRRVRVAVFGAITNEQNNLYRGALADDAAYAAAVAALEAAEGSFLAIDGEQPVWKQYVNLGDNAYWRNHIR